MRASFARASTLVVIVTAVCCACSPEKGIHHTAVSTPKEEVRRESAEPAPSPPPAPEEPAPSPAPAPLAATPKPECQAAQDPPVELLDAFDGCPVSFTSVHVVAARSCTKKYCHDGGCCNHCSAGGMSMTVQGATQISLSRANKPLHCAAGMDCDANENCELAGGFYDVTGVVSRSADGHYWHFDLEKASRRDTSFYVPVQAPDPGRCELGETRVFGLTDTKEAHCKVEAQCESDLKLHLECSGDSCMCRAGAWFTYSTREDPKNLENSCMKALPSCLSEYKRRHLAR